MLGMSGCSEVHFSSREEKEKWNVGTHTVAKSKVKEV